MIYNLICRYLNAGKERTEPGIPAGSLLECSALVRAFILSNDLGAGEWIAGEVYDGKELVAKLAYNGRAIA